MRIRKTIFGRIKDKYIASIISYYSFQNNVLDAKSINNGIAYNLSYATGKVGNSAVFNGTSSYISIADSLSLDLGSNRAFSIVFSLYKTATGNTFFINKRDTNSTAEFQIAYVESGTNLVFQIFSAGDISVGNIQAAVTYAIPLNTWVNYGFSFDGISDAKIYINGILSSLTSSIIGTFTSMANTNSKIVIGKTGFGSSQFINGKVDEFGLFSRVLTAAEFLKINNKINAGKSLI